MRFYTKWRVRTGTQLTANAVYRSWRLIRLESLGEPHVLGRRSFPNRFRRSSLRMPNRKSKRFRGNVYGVGIMTRPPSLGEFEQIVLLAVLRLGENAYGVTIRNEIAACTRREPAPGALYTTLDRMEEKGLVKSHFGDPTPQRGGRAKRYFAVTRKGLEAVTSAQQSYQSLLEGLNLLGRANA